MLKQIAILVPHSMRSKYITGTRKCSSRYRSGYFQGIYYNSIYYYVRSYLLLVLLGDLPAFTLVIVANLVYIFTIIIIII